MQQELTEESNQDSINDHLENSSAKKTYAVTSDDNRLKFITLWNNGEITIKKVSCPSILTINNFYNN